VAYVETEACVEINAAESIKKDLCKILAIGAKVSLHECPGTVTFTSAHSMAYLTSH
jgi:hypothetical protein